METVSRETPPGADPWYVTGLIEGRGAFTYSRSGRSLVMYFSMKVNASDRALLEAVRDCFGGVGRVYAVRGQGDGSGGGVRAWYYRVARTRDLQRVAEHFDRYPLLGGKGESFRIWRQMLDCKSRFRKAEWARLDALARELSAQSDGRL